MVADVSVIGYFAPIAAFLVVAIVIFAVLAKSKILGDNKFVHIFIALAIASIFIAAAGARQYVLKVVPWLAVLIISLVFLILLLGMIGKVADFSGGIGIAVVVVFAVIFLIAAFSVFSGTVVKYLPGPSYGENANSSVITLTDWLYSERVIGALVLIVISALVAWVLVK